ncbi:MAG: HlyD family efflux transporter periplasmic adaptor subunit [Proteobacteria bacterium]|nr:HlyD family efflux transporter periplasmic adaptor subunit [Pseudomonadota bacterium]
MTGSTFRIFVISLLVSQVACDQAPSVEREMPTRPVTVTELAVRNFPRERALTGVVNLYREEEIGFEVGGRVTMVLNEGIEVRGPTFDDKGNLLRPGDPIAAMEGTRFGSVVGALQARFESTRRDLDATGAQLRLARQTLERQQRILTKGAGAQQAVDNAQSAYDGLIAQERARAATVREVRQQIDRAAEDLGDSLLNAPFSGRITKVHIFEGAVVKAGTPIVTLTLMDPVRIQVEVSADDERDIETGDRAVLYPKDPLHNGERVPVNAIVFEKSSVADPARRTFRIDLIVRNARRHVYQLRPELEGLPVINDYLPVIREFQGEGGPLFVHSESLFAEGDKYYVFRIPGVSFNAGGKKSAVGKHIPEKIEVVLGREYTSVVTWSFRSLAESGALLEGDFLILNPQASHLQGVAIGRPQWLFRPRDLIPVEFELADAPKGLYVPRRALVESDDGPALLVVENGIATTRPVTVHETFENLQRVEGEQLSTGTRVIVGGVHYVSDGQPVTVTDVIETL